VLTGFLVTVASLLLLVAMVGAIMLARGAKQEKLYD